MTREQINQRVPDPPRDVPCRSCRRGAYLVGFDSAYVQYKCPICSFLAPGWSEERDFVCGNCGEMRSQHEKVSSVRTGEIFVCREKFDAAFFRFTTPIQELRNAG